MTIIDDTLRCMTLQSGDEDWALVGEFVRAEISRQGMTHDEFAKSAKVERTSISQMGKREGRPLERTLLKIEGALDLPRDLLLYIGQHDWEEIAKATADADLVRWLTRQVEGRTQSQNEQ